MDTFELAVLVALMLWLARRAGLTLSDRGVASLVIGFGRWTGREQIRGEQEEDRDRPWGSAGAPARDNGGDASDRPAPGLVLVRPTTRLAA